MEDQKFVSEKMPYIPTDKAERAQERIWRKQEARERRRLRQEQGIRGDEPDFSTPEWQRFLAEMDERSAFELQQKQEQEDASDLREVYEMLFDFYEGRDGKHGIAAIDIDDIVTEEVDDLKAKRYQNRWENITNPDVLNFTNEKGEKMEDIINNYFDVLFSFYRDNADELQKLGVMDQNIDVPGLAQQTFKEIISHGDTYNSSLNIPLTLQTPSAEFVQVIDPVIRYIDDACMKLEEHFDMAILNKLRVDMSEEGYLMYRKGLKLLNDLGLQSEKFLTFRDKKTALAA